MKILVTGGAGFIGTNLIKRLLAISDAPDITDSYEVVSIDNYSSGTKENEQEGCEYLTQDISTIANNLEGFDAIIHLAAMSRIQPSIADPTQCIQNNFNGTLNILEQARHNNTQVIYAGSSSKHHNLYGSPYAWSKYGGEELCKLYSEVYDVNTTICRFYNVYGPHQIEDGEYSTVIGIFEKQSREGKPLTIVGDGEQRRDFTHVDDIVDGLVRCIGKEHKAVDFELGTGVNYSINEVADMFGGDRKYIPFRPGEYAVTLCDFSKAEKHLGYNPTGNLKTYIKEINEN